ncbi:MAG: DUF11 domain-containing protein [Proteobacteria bacterium]|nr:DUF11 domain-containing protein [Pseudomonadota bacterium]
MTLLLQEKIREVPGMIGNPVRALALCAVLAVMGLGYSSEAEALAISRTITIDGTMTDWSTPTDILTNAGQFSTDGDGSVCPSTDLDADPDGVGGVACSAINPSGRDLAKFAYTWDTSSLFFYVERAVGTSNTTDWFFYIDLDADGFLGSTDKVLRIAWRGSNQNTSRELWDYIPVAGGLGDAIGGDGNTMPGSISNSTSLTGGTGGSADMLSMESWVDFSELGLAGPQSIQFHISSGNSTNLPSGILDNMDGPVGSGLIFADIAVTKVSSVDATGWLYANTAFTYTITITNGGDSPATLIEITDVLPTEVTYVSHAAATGTYDPANVDPLIDDIWFVPSLAVGASTTLTITVTANQVTANTDVTNTATLTDLYETDPTPGNDSASNVVQIRPFPKLVFKKVVSIRFDPVNNAVDPQAIPLATMRYKISVDNTGYGTVTDGSTVITDYINANVDLLHTVIGVGPVIYTDRSSGLTLTTGDIDYYDTAWGATPSPVDGIDTAIRGIRINPQGVFPAWDGVSPTPGFDIEFDVRVK